MEAAAIFTRQAMLLPYTDGLVVDRHRDLGINTLCQALADVGDPLEPEQVCEDLL